VQFSLECVGNPKVLRQAVDVLPRLGFAASAGRAAGTEVSLNMDLIMNGEQSEASSKVTPFRICSSQTHRLYCRDAFPSIA